MLIFIEIFAFLLKCLDCLLKLFDFGLKMLDFAQA